MSGSTLYERPSSRGHELFLVPDPNNYEAASGKVVILRSRLETMPVSRVVINAVAVLLVSAALLLAHCPFASATLASRDVPSGCHHPSPLPPGTHSCCFATHPSTPILIKAELKVDPGMTVKPAETTIVDTSRVERVALNDLLLATSPPGRPLALRI